MFLSCKFQEQVKINVNFCLFVCDKTTFFYKDKNYILTYQRLTDFMISFTYSQKLYIRYRVIFRLELYQTWSLAFQVII